MKTEVRVEVEMEVGMLGRRRRRAVYVAAALRKRRRCQQMVASYKNGRQRGTISVHVAKRNKYFSVLSAS